MTSLVPPRVVCDDTFNVDGEIRAVTAPASLSPLLPPPLSVRSPAAEPKTLQRPRPAVKRSQTHHVGRRQVQAATSRLRAITKFIFRAAGRSAGTAAAAAAYAVGDDSRAS